jgi:hypothetical protein
MANINITIIWKGASNGFSPSSTDTVEKVIKDFVNANAPDLVDQVAYFQLAKVTDSLQLLDRTQSMEDCGVVEGSKLLLTKGLHHQTSNDKIVAGFMIPYTFVLFILSLWALVSVWPKTSAQMVLNSTKSMNITIIPFHTYSVGPEVGLISVMMLAGMIGACIYSLYAMSLHLGPYEDFNMTWTGWYLMRPWIGAGLAFGVYVLIRGGLLTMGSISSVSLLGLAGFSILTGLFTEQVMHKLNDLADTLFGKGPANTPGVTSTGGSTPKQPGQGTTPGV